MNGSICMWVNVRKPSDYIQPRHIKQITYSRVILNMLSAVAGPLMVQLCNPGIVSVTGRRYKTS